MTACEPSGVCAAPPSFVVSGFGVLVSLVRRRRAQLLLEPSDEIAGSVETTRPQQLVPGSHFHEDGEVASGRHRHAYEWDLHAEQLEDVLVQPQPVVFPIRVPSLELHDELHTLRGAGGSDAEQVADVAEAQAANFHVVPRQLRTGPDDRSLPSTPHFNRVVRDQPMAPDDQVEGTFALADAALADDQH